MAPAIKDQILTRKTSSVGAGSFLINSSCATMSAGASFLPSEVVSVLTRCDSSRASIGIVTSFARSGVNIGRVRARGGSAAGQEETAVLVVKQMIPIIEFLCEWKEPENRPE
jgi:hypothetical protein